MHSVSRTLASTALIASLVVCGSASAKVKGSLVPAPPTYDQLIESAVDARKSGDLAACAELLRKAHALEPSAELMLTTLNSPQRPSAGSHAASTRIGPIVLVVSSTSIAA